MAYPVVAASNSSSVVTSSAPAVALPTGITAGDLLIICLAFQDSISSTATTPSGWSLLKNLSNGSSLVRIYVFYKVADGSEGSTVSISTSVTSSAHISYRITGFSGTPEVSTGVTGSSLNAANPDAITPAGGSKDYLIIAVAGCNDGSVFTSFSYTNNQVDVHNGGGSARLHTSTNNVTASSEDPPTNTLNTINDIAALTLAVSPALATAIFLPMRRFTQAVNRASTY
jgi:hypothetical protein